MGLALQGEEWAGDKGLKIPGNWQYWRAPHRYPGVITDSGPPNPWPTVQSSGPVTLLPALFTFFSAVPVQSLRTPGLGYYYNCLLISSLVSFPSLIPLGHCCLINSPTAPSQHILPLLKHLQQLPILCK